MTTDAYDFEKFLADPRVEDLESAPDQQSYILRVGVLFACGLLSAGEARARVQPLGVTVLDSLPDDYRAPRRSDRDH